MNQTSGTALPPEIEIDAGNKELLDQIQVALLHPLTESFRHCLEILQRLAGNVKGKTRLYLDFAPLSFNFVVIRGDGSRWINGGVIFHGAHDGFGSGGAPTFAVSIGGGDGWQIHT